MRKPTRFDSSGREATSSTAPIVSVIMASPSRPALRVRPMPVPRAIAPASATGPPMLGRASHAVSGCAATASLCAPASAADPAHAAAISSPRPAAARPVSVAAQAAEPAARDPCARAAPAAREPCARATPAACACSAAARRASCTRSRRTSRRSLTLVRMYLCHSKPSDFFALPNIRPLSPRPRLRLECRCRFDQRCGRIVALIGRGNALVS